MKRNIHNDRNHCNASMLLLLWLFLISSISTIVISCTDNRYTIIDLRNSNPSSDYIVYFFPRIESNFISRTLTDFPQYCKAQIFVFNSNDTTTAIMSPLYRSQSAGTLTAVSEPVVVTSGNYNFYAVSLKEDSVPITFTSNIATGLKNGIDYLWYAATNQEIDQNGTTIPITFNHMASQLIVNIVNQDRANPIVSILYSDFSPPMPDDNVTWNLLTGEITPATVLDTVLMNMTVNEFKTSAIIVPYTAENDSLAYFAMVEQQNGNYELCQLYIPLPEGGLKSGHSYEYLIYFDADTITLGVVTVAPWINIEVSDDVNAEN